MLRTMLAAGAATLLSASIHAQQTPPEIPYDSVPDFFKLPENTYFGEVAGIALNSQKHVFVLSRGNTTGPAYGAAAAQLLEFDQNGKFVREIGKNLYAWSFSHTVRVDRRDDIWVADKGSDVVVRFDPAGRVKMVFGRKAEASDEGAHPLEHPQPPLRGRRRPVPPGHRRRVGLAGQHLHQRRLHQLARREVRQGRQLGRRRTARTARSAASSTRCTRSRSTPRTGSTSRTAATAGSRCSTPSGKVLDVFTIDVPAPPNAPVAIGNRPVQSPGAVQTQQPGAPWTVCITPPPNQVMYVSDSYPGRIYKMSLDGKVLGWLGGSGRTLKKFGWIHEIACPSENELYVAELLTGAPRS